MARVEARRDARGVCRRGDARGDRARVEVGPVIEVFDRITRDETGGCGITSCSSTYLCWPAVASCRQAVCVDAAVCGRRFRGLRRYHLDEKATAVIERAVELARTAPRSCARPIVELQQRAGVATSRSGYPERDAAWALLTEWTAEREPAQARAGGRGRGARLRAAVRRGRRGLGRRRRCCTTSTTSAIPTPADHPFAACEDLTRPAIRSG